MFLSLCSFVQLLYIQCLLCTITYNSAKSKVQVAHFYFAWICHIELVQVDMQNLRQSMTELARAADEAWCFVQRAVKQGC